MFFFVAWSATPKRLSFPGSYCAALIATERFKTGIHSTEFSRKSTPSLPSHPLAPLKLVHGDLWVGNVGVSDFLKVSLNKLFGDLKS